MDLRLKGKKVLVSGGSRGIGRAIVEAFLAEGASVSFCARSEAGVRDAEASLKGHAVGFVVDMQNPEQVSRWVHESAEKLGGIDILVPNVSALACGNDLDTWRKAFQTDILGSVSLVNASLSSLQQSPESSVVLISSVSGREIDLFAEPYGVLKGALTHYGKTLALRYAQQGIRVNTVAPGNIYFADGVWGDIERNDSEGFAKCLALNPMGRMGTPEEVANAVLFLASPVSSFTTGTTLLVDGGLTKAVQY